MLRPRSLLLLCMALATIAPSPSFAQTSLKRPVRQVEMDDGVIEITNSNASAPGATQELTSVRALQAGTERDSSQDSALKQAIHSRPHAAAQGAAEGGAPVAEADSAATSWLLLSIATLVAVGVSIWGLRRRRLLMASRSVPSALGTDGATEAGTLPDDLVVLHAGVLDESAALGDAEWEAGQVDGGQWGLAVRDSVPPSAPPRSSRANAPRQWVSQPLRVKSNGS